MTTRKITELPSANTVAPTDLLVVVTNPNNLSTTQKVSVNTLFTNAVATFANIALVDKRTPANSSISVSGGTVFYDDNYLYISIANNVVKRITLESF